MITAFDRCANAFRQALESVDEKKLSLSAMNNAGHCARAVLGYAGSKTEAGISLGFCIYRLLQARTLFAKNDISFGVMLGGAYVAAYEFLRQAGKTPPNFEIEPTDPPIIKGVLRLHLDTLNAYSLLDDPKTERMCLVEAGALIVGGIEQIANLSIIPDAVAGYKNRRGGQKGNRINNATTGNLDPEGVLASWKIHKQTGITNRQADIATARELNLRTPKEAGRKRIERARKAAESLWMTFVGKK